MDDITGASPDGDRAGHEPSPDGLGLSVAIPSAIECEPMHAITEDGWCEWTHPLPGYLMQCCDCGLVHEMEYAIVPRDDELNTGPLNDGEGQTVILFRARRHLSPLERAKASYQPMRSLDEIVGIERESEQAIKRGR